MLILPYDRGAAMRSRRNGCGAFLDVGHGVTCLPVESLGQKDKRDEERALALAISTTLASYLSLRFGVVLSL